MVGFRTLIRVVYIDDNKVVIFLPAYRRELIVDLHTIPENVRARMRPAYRCYAVVSGVDHIVHDTPETVINPLFENWEET